MISWFQAFAFKFNTCAAYGLGARARVLPPRATGDNTIRIWNTVHRNCEIALTAGVVAVTPGGGKMGYMDILAVIN